MQSDVVNRETREYSLREWRLSVLDPRVCLERHVRITAATNASNMEFMTCSHAQIVKTMDTQNNGLRLSRPPTILRSPADRTDELVKVAQASLVSNLSSEGISQVSTASATGSFVLQSAATSASSKDLSSLSVSAIDLSLRVSTKLVVWRLTYASLYRNRSTENNFSKAITSLQYAIEINESKIAC